MEHHEQDVLSKRQDKHNNYLSRNTHIPHPPPPLVPSTNKTSGDTTTQLLSSSNRNSVVTPPTNTSENEIGNQSNGRSSSACSSCKHRKKLPGGLQDISERVSRIKSREKAGGIGRDCSGVRTSGRTRRHVLKPLNESTSNGQNSDNHTVAERLPEDNVTGSSLRSFGGVIKENCQLPDIFNSSSSDLASYKSLLNWARPKSSGKSREKNNSIALRPISKARKKTPELKLSSKLVSYLLFLNHTRHAFYMR